MAKFSFRAEATTESELIAKATADFARGGGRYDTPEEAAIWMIEELDDQNMHLNGKHLHEFDLWVVTHSIIELPDNRRQEGALAINRGVDLLRSRVDRLNALGWLSGQVARGLWVPWSIQYRYETIFQSEFPWGISVVAQNAFLGNPLVGERKPWRNKRPLSPSAR